MLLSCQEFLWQPFSITKSQCLILCWGFSFPFLRHEILMSLWRFVAALFNFFSFVRYVHFGNFFLTALSCFVFYFLFMYFCFPLHSHCLRLLFSSWMIIYLLPFSFTHVCSCPLPALLLLSSFAQQTSLSLCRCVCINVCVCVYLLIHIWGSSGWGWVARCWYTTGAYSAHFLSDSVPNKATRQERRGDYLSQCEAATQCEHQE